MNKQLIVLWNLQLVNINDVADNKNPFHRWWQIGKQEVVDGIFGQITALYEDDKEQAAQEMSKAVELKKGAFSSSTTKGYVEMPLPDTKSGRGPGGFAGSMVSSIRKADIKELFKGNMKYWISRKSDGIRDQLYFTIYDGHMISVFIDRADRMFLLSIPCPTSFFKGTLLDGDMLLANNGSFEFHMYNCIQLNGLSVRRESYLQRMQVAQNGVHGWYHLLYTSRPDQIVRIYDSKTERTIAPLSTDDYAIHRKRFILQFINPAVCPISFWVKPIFHLWQGSAFVKYIQPIWDKQFASDGYTLTPNESAEEKGYKGKTYKLKFGNDNTVELQVMMVPVDEFKRMSNDLFARPVSDQLKQQIIKEHTLVPLLWTYEFVPTGTAPKLFTVTSIPATFQPINLHKKIVECRWSYEQKAWFIEKVRARTSANAWPTIQATEENVNDNLTLEDVLLFLKDESAKLKNFIPDDVKNPGRMHMRMPFIQRQLCKVPKKVETKKESRVNQK